MLKFLMQKFYIREMDNYKSVQNVCHLLFIHNWLKELNQFGMKLLILMQMKMEQQNLFYWIQNQNKKRDWWNCFYRYKYFGDQMLHDFSVNLTDESNTIVRAKLHLKVQWIYSKNKYLQDLINENMIQVNQLEQEINDHIIDLDIINQPFKQAIKFKKNLTISTYQTYQNQYGSPLLISESQIDRLVQISLLLIIFYLVFCFLNSLYRTLNFDFLVIFYCFLFYQKNYKLQSLLHIKIIIIMLGIALLMDIIWLAIYSTPYLGEFNASYDHLEYSLQKYQIILSWLLLFVKIIVLIFYVHIYATYPDKSTQVYDQQWNAIFGWKDIKQINIYRNYN